MVQSGSTSVGFTWHIPGAEARVVADPSRISAASAARLHWRRRRAPRAPVRGW
jgi:hypothetical protein